MRILTQSIVERSFLISILVHSRQPAAVGTDIPIAATAVIVIDKRLGVESWQGVSVPLLLVNERALNKSDNDLLTNWVYFAIHLFRHEATVDVVDVGVAPDAVRVIFGHLAPWHLTLSEFSGVSHYFILCCSVLYHLF